MFKLKTLSIVENMKQLGDLPEGKLLINTINAYSYNKALEDELFAKALSECDALLPDGASIVKACRIIKAKCRPQERIAGWDLFIMEMERLNRRGGKCFFMGSSEKVLGLIRKRAAADYPNITVETYSPPFRDEFDDRENRAIIDAINAADPDLLWVGMTAPKQEKWAFANWKDLHIHCHTGSIGAVFDFYAGTAQRAPIGWQKRGFEWLYRLIKEPGRMWRRYLIGNVKFLWYIYTRE